MQTTEARIYCFGEMLWDMLPDGPRPGGAPLNVAYHLSVLGRNPEMISRVGRDEAGTTLLSILKKAGVGSRWVGVDDRYDTSSVEVRIDPEKGPSYEIVSPVAWDFIPDNGVSDEVSESDVLLFGSLASRNERSRDTLASLLDRGGLNVCDLNLRPPHYTRETVRHLLDKADILKMNRDELREVAGWYGAQAEMESEMRYLANKFRAGMVIVTLGDEGAACLAQGDLTRNPGVPVRVMDTVGSGDAFFAGFLHRHLAESPPEECLAYGCAMGAFVASRAGAMPDYTPSDLRDFLSKAGWEGDI